MCIVWTHFVFPVARLSWIISLTVRFTVPQIQTACWNRGHKDIKWKISSHACICCSSCSHPPGMWFPTATILQPPTGGVKNTDHLDTTQLTGWSLGSWRSRGAPFTVPADQTYAPVTTTHAVLAFTDVKGLLAVHISNIITDRLLPSLKFYKNDISASVLELLCETFSKLLFIVDDSPSHFGQSRSAGIS